MKKSIAVDFDGTLCTSAYPDVGERLWIHKLVAWYVKRKANKGWVVIINSLRDMKNDVVGYGPHVHMIEALNEWGIPWTFVNENMPDATEHFGYARKIQATRYLDDRNVGLIGAILRHYSRKRRHK